MAREIKITPFEEYLRMTGELDDFEAVNAEPEAALSDMEPSTEVEASVDHQIVAEQAEPVGDWDLVGQEPEPIAETDVGQEDELDQDILADLSNGSTTSSDLDALFQELLKASVQSVQSTSDSNVQSSDANQANQESDNRIAQLEQVVENLTKIVQQTATALQAHAQMTMAEQEARALREVTRQLQADGIFFTDDQLRDILKKAQEQGIPYSIAVKAAAWDAQQLYRAPASPRPLAETPFRYPFLAQSESAAPRVERTNLSPYRVRSFSEYLEEVERALSEQTLY